MDKIASISMLTSLGNFDISKVALAGNGSENLEAIIELTTSNLERSVTVSYTHLTLPTNREV